MYDDGIADWKQFIVAIVSQQTAYLAAKEDLSRLESKIDKIQAARWTYGYRLYLDC